MFKRLIGYQMEQLIPAKDNTTGRILWIDMVRGILILFVILGHNIQFGSGAEMLNSGLFFENPVFRFLYSFHMPCMMLISGYFFGYSIAGPGMWKNKFRTLIVPMIVWSLIPVGQILFEAVLYRWMSRTVALNCLLTFITYYWFLWAILFGVIIVWIVHTFLKDSIIAYVLIGIALLFVPDFPDAKMWIYMYPFFVTGYLWNRKQVRLRWAENHKIVTMGILVAAFAILFVFYNTDSFVYTTGITVRSLSQLGIDLYRYAIGFVGSSMLIWLVYIVHPLISRKVVKAIAYCGRVSLTVYCLDILLDSYLIPEVTGSFNLNYGIVLIETIIVLFFCLGVDYLIRQVPFMRKVLLGNRNNV